MKFTWEAKDMVCGRIICKPTHQFSDRKRPSEQGFKPCGWTAKHTYKLGWLAGGNPLQKEDYKLEREARAAARKDYCLIA
jgi:hypothetical protein